MIVGAAFCPHPPLLVPEVAAGAAAELDGVRAACDAAIAGLLAQTPDVVVVLGGGPVLATYADDAAGTLAGFGVAVRAGGPGPAVLPLSLTVGAWLLDRAGYAGPRTCVAVPAEVSAAPPLRASGPVGNASAVRELRNVLLGTAQRAGLLVMADASACRDEKAPGALDPRAAEYDASVARALAAGDAAALRAVAADPVAVELLVAGAPAWAAAADLLVDAGPLAARLLADAAPYGVGYLVALWTTTGRAGSVLSTTTDAVERGAHSRK